jgi:D-aspartate ligase
MNVTGYGIIRALRRAGGAVHAVREGPNQFAVATRLCASVKAIPQGDGEVDSIIELLRRIGGRPVLFPTSDRYAALIAHARDRLEPHARFHWVDPDTLWSTADKGRADQICREAGIPVPVAHVTTTEDTATSVARIAKYPCILKPVDSVGIGLPGGAKNLVIANSTELESFLDRYPTLLGRVIVQEVIEGSDDSIVQCVVLISGERSSPVAIATMRKLRQYPPGFGMTCFGRTEILPEVEGLTMSFLSKIDWRGIAALEFKRSARDGRYYFIEMNPRLPWYNALLLDSGLNFPDLVSRDLGSELGSAGPQRTSRIVHWLCFEHDMATFLRRRREARGRSLEWLRSLTRARSFAWFELGDPGPFLRASGHLLALALRWLAAPRR